MGMEGYAERSPTPKNPEKSPLSFEARRDLQLALAAMKFRKVTGDELVLKWIDAGYAATFSDYVKSNEAKAAQINLENRRALKKLLVKITPKAH
jgi:DNA-binding protein Fis